VGFSLDWGIQPFARWDQPFSHNEKNPAGCVAIHTSSQKNLSFIVKFKSGSIIGRNRYRLTEYGLPLFSI
jgi:hypothetical protein